MTRMDQKRHPHWEGLRQRAEKVLMDSSSAANNRSRAELAELVHELEVHRVELDMQEDELRGKNQELKTLLHRYAELYQKAPIGFVNLSTKGVIVEANIAASEMLGIPKERLRNVAFSRFVNFQDRQRYYEIYTKISLGQGEKGRGELRLLRLFTDSFYVQFEVVPVRAADGGSLDGWLVAFIDLSQRIQAEEALQHAYERLEASKAQLKGLSGRLLSSLEDERKRIARELHDSIGQTLAMVKCNLATNVENMRRLGMKECFFDIEHLIPIVQSALDEVRVIQLGLRPPMLDEVGVLASVRWLCQQVRSSFPRLRIEIAWEMDEKEVPENLKIVIFRIIQEALNNVVRHSEANRVALSLVRMHNEIGLSIEDDGVGFDVKAVTENTEARGMGLLSMKERAELLGGTLSVESQEGRGTQIQATWKI